MWFNIYELFGHFLQCCDKSVVFRSNVLQESLIKLVEACNDQSHSMDRWLSKLEASSWQTHVKEILTTACLAAQCIDRSGNKVCLLNMKNKSSIFINEKMTVLRSESDTLSSRWQTVIMCVCACLCVCQGGGVSAGSRYRGDRLHPAGDLLGSDHPWSGLQDHQRLPGTGRARVAPGELVGPFEALPKALSSFWWNGWLRLRRNVFVFKAEKGTRFSSEFYHTGIISISMSGLISALNPFLTTRLTSMVFCLRRVTHSASAALSQPTPTANLARRPPSSCSSWTACGRSFASFLAPLNSARASWCCSSNMPTLLSSAPSWATVQLRGKSAAVGLPVYAVFTFIYDTHCHVELHNRMEKNTISAQYSVSKC